MQNNTDNLMSQTRQQIEQYEKYIRSKTKFKDTKSMLEFDEKKYTMLQEIYGSFAYLLKINRTTHNNSDSKFFDNLCELKQIFDVLPK